MIAMAIKKAKVMFAARLTPLVKRIIDAEVLARGLHSEADFVELAALACATSAESKRLMLEEIHSDPKIAAMLAAFGIKMPADKPPKK